MNDLNKKVEELEEKLRVYEESPLESSYNACRNTIEKFNKQLSEKTIDIFNVEDKPKFEMAHKYLTELDGYLKTLDSIRMKMSPEIAKRTEQKAKNDKASEKDKSLAL